MSTAQKYDVKNRAQRKIIERRSHLENKHCSMNLMRVKYTKDRTEWWLGVCIHVDRRKQGDLLVLLRKS